MIVWSTSNKERQLKPALPQPPGRLFYPPPSLLKRRGHILSHLERCAQSRCCPSPRYPVPFSGILPACGTSRTAVYVHVLALQRSSPLALETNQKKLMLLGNPCSRCTTTISHTAPIHAIAVYSSNHNRSIPTKSQTSQNTTQLRHSSSNGTQYQPIRTRIKTRQ